MSNPGRGRGYSRSGGSNRSGNSNKNKQFPTGQRTEEEKDWQANSSPENLDTSGTLSASFDNKQKNYENKNNSAKGKPQNASKRNGVPVRAFKIANNGNAGTESEQKLSSEDEMKERVRSTVRAYRSIDSASASNSEKLLNSSLPSDSHCISTGSGIFKWSPNLPTAHKSRQSGSNNAEGYKDYREEHGEGGNLKGESCITEIEDDLFNAPDDVSLAHCVGADFRMGSGIALRFWEKFKSVGRLFDQQIGPGGVAFLEIRLRFVFYLVTKQASTDKPTKDTIRSSLLALREKCKELHVTKLAMPQIGCGLDGFEWDEVKRMLEEIFADGFVITIYKLDKEFVNTPRSSFKTRVKNANLMLKDIDQGTGLLYIGYESRFISEEMKSINEKYPFISRLRNTSYRLGSVYYTRIQNDIVFGLICKQSENSPLNYEHLEKAIDKLIFTNKKFGYGYFGLQAFEEKDDPYVMEKIETLFRNTCMAKNVELWICWPPRLEHKHPSNSEQSSEVMQVESFHPSTGIDQSSSQHSSNFAKQSKERKSSDYSSKGKDKRDNRQKSKNSQHQHVTEVVRKLNAQSLADESVPEEAALEPDHSTATKDTSNTSDVTWDNEHRMAQIDEDFDGSHIMEEDESNWKDDVEDAKRMSIEKKQTNELNREKERLEKKKSVKPRSCVTECKGDLFDAEDTISLAHCVGADFRMGSGIAVLFRQTFQSIPELLDQRVTQGGVAFLKVGKRYIFYLVTKTESTGKPTYGTLEKSLHALRDKCAELKITELAMPRIGCGLDRLEWTEVREMLENIFGDGFSIRIYNLEKEYKETKKSNPITTIKNEILLLKDILPGTGLLYIDCVEPYVSPEMKSLDEKYPFLQRIDKNKPKALGAVVRTETPYPKAVLYGLVCRKSRNDPVSYVYLKAALRQVEKHNRDDAYSYFGIQAFEERNDDNNMSKIETMLRYSRLPGEAWICFPENLKDLMTPSSLPAYYSLNTYSSGRNRSEMDSQQIGSTLRDVQRTQELTYRKLIILEDIRNEIFGYDGLKGRISQMEEKLNEYASLHESHTKLENRVKILETRNHELEERNKMLEQESIHSLTSNTVQNTGGNIDGGNLNTGFSNGPIIPLIPNQPGPQLCLTPADYLNSFIPVMHPGYVNNSQFYASEQLPEEKQALIFAAETFAYEKGYETMHRDGFIYVRKNDFENYTRIANYGDLNSLQN